MSQISRQTPFVVRGWLPAALIAVVASSLAIDVVSAAPPRRSAGQSYESDYGLVQVRTINERVRNQWKEYELTPSRPATDGEWCRRVYLDILGRIPSVEELKAFVGDSTPDKKARLVNKLLYDESYTEEYARNMTTLWTNTLIGRSGGTGQDTMVNRQGMQKYLRDTFARNKPYDRMVYELVSATGSSAPGQTDPPFNGAVNFLADKMAEGGLQAAADTSKIFLGLQVQCTQCHNHPFNEWKQRKFWEMNAFFRQTQVRNMGVGTDDGGANSVMTNIDFAGENRDPDEAALFYELRNGLLKVAYPVFVDDTEIGKSGWVSEVDRRTELAKMMVQSEYLPKTMVNRVWQHFMGYGFTKPIDDMGPHNPATHPELLVYLGEEFKKSSFNVKELIRWVALSEAYSLSSKVTEGNKIDDPLIGEPPKFSHFYLRQMRAEELYESLLVATQAHKTRGTYEEQEDEKSKWLQQFVQAFGTDEGDETTSFNGTIPQALMMFNGDLIKQATSNAKGSFLDTVATGNLKPTEKIDYLFEAALARRPNKNELEVANKLLYAREGNVTSALQDVWWAVLNSNEFILNH